MFTLRATFSEEFEERPDWGPARPDLRVHRRGRPGRADRRAVPLRGGLKPEQAADVVRRLTDIVGFAHRLQPPVVHRNLKPANMRARPDLWEGREATPSPNRPG